MNNGQPINGVLPDGPGRWPHPDMAAAGPACILVVDDQPANIQMVGSVLGPLGHEIIPAMDGATALKRIALQRPDLILLDVLMPEPDGYEVCRRLQANPAWRDLPVIFLSAADDKDLIVRALNSGGVDYITKPFNQNELISRVRTQLALKTARDQLRQLAEDKDELMGMLAHDLKNFLGGTHLSAQMLAGEIHACQNPRLIQMAENILRTSEQSLAFLKGFLANAAAEHRLVVKPGAFNFSAVAAGVIRRHQEAARRKQLTLHGDFPEEPVLAYGDAAALDQVLDNLLSNALKFSPPGKPVRVIVRPAGRQAECVVRDEGPGFTADDLARMFHRYQRLSARPTGGESSTGLGLCIVRKLVLAMNGKIACDSEPGRGAAFTVRLPGAETAQPGTP
jgi:two-component system sensor histidine kinase/response regulator